MELLIARDVPRPAGCSLGTLTVASLLLDTIERPWIADPNGSPCGDPDVSCVPLGLYQLVLHNTTDKPCTFALVNPALGIYHEEEDIPPGARGRFACLLHSANYAWQLEGCIAPGLARLPIGKSAWMVTNSVKAIEQLFAVVPWVEGHSLEIT